MAEDIGAFRKVTLPSPRLFGRLVAERDKARARTLDEIERRAEAAIEDALFDEAIDRQIREIAA